jgi:hypothetical protein
MKFEILENWEVIVDGVQIFLCLLVLFFFIRNRQTKKYQTPMNAGRKTGKDFNAHVLTQTIKQQVDRAFASVIEAVALEQERLEKVLQDDRPGNDSWEISEYHLRSRFQDRNERSRETDVVEGGEKRFERINNLAAGGMNSRQISEELKAPLSEVELILSLNGENN